MSKFYYNQEQESYDAIVVGTGISGGWAAKELCENGLKTLVLERGPMVKHREDYPTANLDPWDFPNAGQPTREELKQQEKQARTGYTVRAESKHWFVNDLEHPYNEVKRFDWMRGYHVGGRSIMWGRHSYRWSDIDFTANKNEGIAVDWPVRYKDIAPWYDKVESYIGVSGESLGLPQLPDGQFEPMMELNCVEEHVKGKVAEHFNGRVITAGRVAHINSDKKFEGDGRVRCQFRNRCVRGCPFGAYFSSVSSTLPAAERTGNMTLRPDSIVHEIIYDPNTKKATGVKVIDRETKEEFEFKAKVIFLCASAVASTSILMQSKSDRFPNGLGNDSDQLGRNIMDHHFLVGASGKFDGFDDKYYKGRKPNGTYIPRFRNLGGDTDMKDFTRGYGYQGGASRGNYEELVAEASFGKGYKDAILTPGGWTMNMLAFGEILPYEDNRMILDYDKKDKWGLPTVTFDAEIRQNELNMRKDMQDQAVQMLEKAGAKDITPYDNPYAIGLGIHEMGTARMGLDPKTSVVNGYNQVHACKNVYVTDGAFMASASCVNPSLTYMAFTARAANHAAQELKKGNI
ncbi:GMC family oxidoreductase [Flagellimonas taeanensis]|jgi:choline dehydrogenase-like flavoprotein|uniref:Choline dehydrogenase n=1 Tax=Flagellimonas taeanensis TaxID=1005926 RepID=A0A1M6XWE2_9FLAO|nr:MULTISPECIES: GMC family oxidoreductase [Allomuricauda]MDC6383754.1 GMC family oxidoreductase [Muricauda sp. SK9]MEE1961767.1 GMC family oxidoreductase [Allomuricauda taeanensis]RIV48384.1 GMC family oxidoreductase [Allomuricauda taeanensis]SFC03674.1 Choline dehydrogenase [Allomuricauda taeanensis]SHL10342.1 Choline dehydrogenase [Allomuricauda taeanensis]